MNTVARNTLLTVSYAINAVSFLQFQALLCQFDFQVKRFTAENACRRPFHFVQGYVAASRNRREN
jgi:hypothetical protein